MLWSVQDQPMGNVKSTAIAEWRPSNSLDLVSSLLIQDMSGVHFPNCTLYSIISWSYVQCKRQKINGIMQASTGVKLLLKAKSAWNPDLNHQESLESR